jgi:TolB-like protein/Tfp pilus assembly protein PilF
MGQVYRARDEHLDRDVAVKVLPAGTLADEAARQRFRKEALALSRLSHPNIQTVFDFATQAGLDFLVTEYVPGVTLSDRLAGKGLPQKEVLRLGQQLAEGLAAAHEKGIVHRDLKPSNLRVTPEGRLKILDFGVAKLLAPVSATATTETATPTVAGTPLYMAPEQRRGEPVDARSDLYAVGLVLWEMATGKPPMAGRGLSGEVSPELQRMVEKCLEEDPDLRYQSARDLLADLRRLAVASATPRRQSPVAPATGIPGTSRQVPGGSVRLVLRWGGAGVVAVAAVLGVFLGLNIGGVRERLFGAGAPKLDSIAVLPLKNLMGDTEQDYFVEGMHEALTAELSKISALKVISRTSTVRYKDTDKTMPQIARELGVNGLIEGSVLREGDQVRITVQLIHGPSDKHLWAESYQRELRGVLALHSEVARAIAREINVAVTPAEATRLARTRPVSPAAHDAYLRGRFEWNKRTRASVRKAVEHFQQAIELDPGYALAHVGLADAYNILGFYGDLPPKESFPRAKRAARRALELDSSMAEAHASLAYASFYYDWDVAAAERGFQRAIELRPGYAVAHHWYANLLARGGHEEQALTEIRRAQELDPLAVIMKAAEGWVLYLGRRYDESIAVSRKALELDPDYALARLWMSWSLQQLGRCAEAIAESEAAVRLAAGSPYFLASLGYTYGVCGRSGEAEGIRRQLEALSHEAYVSPYHRAEVELGLGRKEEALRSLGQGLEDRANLLVLLKVEPKLDPLRGDRRFQALLRRMNFPEE